MTPPEESPVTRESGWGAALEIAGEVQQTFVRDGMSLSAQAIAYKLVVATVPVVGLGLAVLSRFVGAGARGEAVALLGRLVPPELATEAVTLLLSVGSVRGPLTVASALGSGAVAVLLFSTFRRTTERALGRGDRRGLAALAFDARMAVQAGGLFVAAIVAAVLLGMPGSEGALERLLPASGWASVLSGGLGDVLALILPGVLGLGVAVQLFRLVPRPHPPWRSALVGGAVTAVTWEAARWMFGVYLGAFGPLQTYSGALSALGAGLAFLTWAYLTGLALVLGAVACGVHEQRSGRAVGPGQPNDAPGQSGSDEVG